MASTSKSKLEENGRGETYFQYYLRKYSMWLSILLSLFLLLDGIALFIATQYSFIDVFLYFGILLTIFTVGVDLLLWFEESLLWAVGAIVLTGFVPAIELIVFLASKHLTGGALALAIISLLLALSQIALPVMIVFRKNLRKGKNEGSKKS